MTNEEILTNFMREHYTDERLCWLLEHALSGKLAFYSCCCFIGITSSDHALRGKVSGCLDFIEHGAHYFRARDLLYGAVEAEEAFLRLAKTDEEKRAKLIPLVEAEIARREAVKAIEPIAELVAV